MIGKSRTENGMGQAINWKTEIEVLAGPFDGNRKSWLSRAVRKSGATYRQVKALYYGETTDPKLSVAASVLSAADQARIERGKKNAAIAVDAFRIAMQRYQNVDEDFYRHDIDILQRAISDSRVLDSAGNKGEVKC